MTAALIATLGLIVLLLGLLVAGLLRSHAEILRKLESLGAGIDVGGHRDEAGHELTLSPTRRVAGAAPDIAGVNPDGEPVVVSTTVGEDPLLIAFLSTTCSSCTMFWENLDQPTRTFRITPAPRADLDLGRKRGEPHPSPSIDQRRC